MTAQLIEIQTPPQTTWLDAPADLRKVDTATDLSCPEFGHGAVSDWMRPLAGTCTEDTPLREAVELMVSSDVDHLVIVDNAGMLAGLISYRSLVALVARGAYVGPNTAGALLNRAPVTTAPSTPFADALRLLDPPDVTCVVVVEDGRPLGVISEAHLAHPTLELVASSL